MVYKKKSAIFILLVGILLILTVIFASRTNTPFAEYSINSPEDVVFFLSDLGWECDLNNITTQNSQLPEQFDTVLLEYNTLQLQQGCDLTNYGGKEITVYTVPILNYSNSSENICAPVIVHKSSVIGGDIHSSELNGFMHTLC